MSLLGCTKNYLLNKNAVSEYTCFPTAPEPGTLYSPVDVKLVIVKSLVIQPSRNCRSKMVNILKKREIP